MCDEVINVTDNVSTNVTNIVPTNITSTVPINFDNKKVRWNGLLNSTHGFISDHTTIYNHYYLSSLFKT